MADNDVQVKENEIKETSKMAGRLKDVLDECAKTKGEKILVPQDVKRRMKNLCSETEKIIKDMPNKKFSAAVHVHAGEKAQKYLDTLNTEISKAYYNLNTFAILKNFYGVSEGNVKSSIKKYDDRMKKYDKELAAIYEKTRKLVNENSELLNKKELKSFFDNIKSDKNDQNLINSGRIFKGDVKNQTYERYIKAFFDKFINCKIGDGKKDLVSAFKDISIALRKLKVKVSENEVAIVGDGIRRSREDACSEMHRINQEVNFIIREANKSISFLKSLPIKSSELSDERDKQVGIIEKAVSRCNSTLNDVDVFKSSIVYGETTFSSDKKSPLAIGKGVDGTFLRANSLRKILNTFIKSLDDIVSDIQGGREVEYVSDEANNLNRLYRGIEKDLSNFTEEVEGFKGYFKKDVVNNVDKNKNSNEETLKRIDAEYNRITQKLKQVGMTSDAKKDVDKFRSMEKKIKKEVEEYDKVSSKIKRGVKKVFNVMGTMARYTLNVTEFLKNVLFISDTWSGLANSLSKNDEAAAQVIAVPIARS